MTVREKIKAGEYPLNDSSQFEIDALEETGIATHPKKEQAFNLAWLMGSRNHTSAPYIDPSETQLPYLDVLLMLEELAELMKE